MPQTPEDGAGWRELECSESCLLASRTTKGGSLTEARRRCCHCRRCHPKPRERERKYPGSSLPPIFQSPTQWVPPIGPNCQEPKWQESLGNLILHDTKQGRCSSHLLLCQTTTKLSALKQLLLLMVERVDLPQLRSCHLSSFMQFQSDGSWAAVTERLNQARCPRWHTRSSTRTPP